MKWRVCCTVEVVLKQRVYGAVKQTVDKHTEGVVKVPTERAAELQRQLTAQ